VALQRLLKDVYRRPILEKWRGMMIVDPKYTELVRTESASETEPRVAPLPSAEPPATPKVTEVDETSRVLAVHNELAMVSSLDPARAAQIRRRVLTRAYEATAVVDALARRILESGVL
jgi:hypothetical protein